MRVMISWLFYSLIAFVLAAATPLQAQQQPDSFRWVDFHSGKDQDAIVWVSRTLAAEKWTAIREIGIQYDAALVITTQRATPQSLGNTDTFAVWSVSLTNHSLTPLLKGANLRWLDWMLLAYGKPREVGILYDNCAECAADTYLTAFHYDLSQHVWAARWMRGGHAAPVSSANATTGVAWTAVYAVLAEPDGRQLLSTWNHFDYGKQKPPEDFVYQYDLDPFSGLERTQLLSGKQAEAIRQRLCSAQDSATEAVPGMARGQDSPLCMQTLKPRPERKPVTTPPANNHGQSLPPGSRHY
jgi:hypothetical protein